VREAKRNPHLRNGRKEGPWEAKKGRKRIPKANRNEARGDERKEKKAREGVYEKEEGESERLSEGILSGCV
jgi:hypothetical protein